MTQQNTGGADWRRNRSGLGVWPHQGKVAIAGWSQSPVDRRWDGVNMDRTLGAYAILAVKRALEDAGIKPEDVDGLLCCPENMAGNPGPAGSWGPYRPYFPPPYDSEDGLTVVSNNWLRGQMPELTNIQYAPDHVPAIGDGMGFAAQACADGMYKVGVYVYTANNLEGRYRQGGEFDNAHVSGNRQWAQPWGDYQGLMTSTNVPIQQYCERYGVTWDELLSHFVINQHRNGLLKNPDEYEGWSYYYQYGPSQLTTEDYVNSRHIYYPLKIWDCDRPVNSVGAFVFATAERAMDMRQKPVYVANHSQGSGGRARSSQETLDDTEKAKEWVASLVYEGSGWSPSDVDIFNPYDGFSTFMPTSLEAFQWHGVQKGDAADFLRGDIRVEGPHPFCSGGGNLGNGRTRTAMYIDSIQQLRGTAGPRQVSIKGGRPQTAICACAPGNSAAYLCLTNEPSG